MRLPDITLAILLTSCSPETRPCGRALLETICEELNFQAGHQPRKGLAEDGKIGLILQRHPERGFI